MTIKFTLPLVKVDSSPRLCGSCGGKIAVIDPTTEEVLDWKIFSLGKLERTFIGTNGLVINIRITGVCLYCGKRFNIEIPRVYSGKHLIRPGVDEPRGDETNTGTRSIKNRRIVCDCGQHMSWVEERKAGSYGFVKIAPTQICETIVDASGQANRVILPDPPAKIGNNDPSMGYFLLTALNFIGWIALSASSAEYPLRAQIAPKWIAGKCLNRNCKLLHWIPFEERMQFLRQIAQECEAKK